MAKSRLPTFDDSALNVEVPMPDYRAPWPDVSVPIPRPNPNYVQEVMDEAQHSDEVLERMRRAQSTDRDNSDD